MWLMAGESYLSTHCLTAPLPSFEPNASSSENLPASSTIVAGLRATLALLCSGGQAWSASRHPLLWQLGPEQLQGSSSMVASLGVALSVLSCCSWLGVALSIVHNGCQTWSFSIHCSWSQNGYLRWLPPASQVNALSTQMWTILFYFGENLNTCVFFFLSFHIFVQVSGVPQICREICLAFVWPLSTNFDICRWGPHFIMRHVKRWELARNLQGMSISLPLLPSFSALLCQSSLLSVPPLFCQSFPIFSSHPFYVSFLLSFLFTIFSRKFSCYLLSPTFLPLPLFINPPLFCPSPS